MPDADLFADLSASAMAVFTPGRVGYGVGGRERMRSEREGGASRSRSGSHVAKSLNVH